MRPEQNRRSFGLLAVACRFLHIAAFEWFFIMLVMRQPSGPLSGPLLLLLGLFSATPVLAGAQQISPAQQAAIFPDQKQLILRDQRDRLQVIQASLHCVTAASIPSQLMGCLVQEHQDNQRINAEHHNAMVSILRQHGVIPAAEAPSSSGSRP